MLNSIQENSEGQIILAGHTNSTSGDVKSNKGSYDTWLLKTCFSVTTISEKRCYSYTVPSGEETYSSSGIYKDTVLNSNNCNNFITINLKINNTKSNVNKNACNSFIVPSGDETYYKSGIYHDTIPNSLNCDSIITFDLEIIDIDTSVSINSESELEADLIGGTYQWLDCNNNFAPIQGETNQTFKPDSSGKYAVKVSKNGCTDTSKCFNIQNLGILENTFNPNLNFYPNPTEGNLTIELGDHFPAVTAKIKDLSGKELGTKSFENTSIINFDLNGSTGAYLIEIHGPEGNKASFKVLKK